MDPTESEFFSKAKAEKDPAAPPTNWTIPLLAAVAALGAIVVWRVLVQPPAAPVDRAEPEPPPVVKAPVDTDTRTFSAPPAVERPEKPPAPPKDFGN
jgi:hypothetical protein